MTNAALCRTTFAALVLATAPLAAQCPDGTPPPCKSPRRAGASLAAIPAPADRARRFLLLPFRNVTRGAAQDWLVAGAPLMLGESLGQFHDLTVVSDAKLSAARHRLSIRADSQPDATQLRRLAEETDGWTAVTGNVYAMGPRLRITVLATDVPTARVITQRTTELAIDADVRQAFDSLTVLLVAPTGVRGARADLTALTTQSSDAYRAYVRGVELMGQSAYLRAQRAFADAVALDSTFALAWSRLAYSTANANIWTLIDASSPAVRAIETAVRMGARLPPRQLETIRAVQHYMRGQQDRARHTLDSLVQSDRDDLDAREMLAGIELNDTALDTAGGTPRMATSMNRGLELAREVLDRDPGRRNVHNVYAMAYAMAGGWWLGQRMGVLGEYSSFLATITRLLMPGPDATFVPVLRDSLVLVPEADFRRLSFAERARLRRRSADVGMEWVDRWLLVGPSDAEAHLWASRLAELRDDAPRALRELAAAESLGVQSAWENVAQRRLQLLLRAEQPAAAARIADSLAKAGVLPQRSLVPGLDAGRGYALAAYLMLHRWADAGALVAAIRPGVFGRPLCAVALGELSNGTDEVSGGALRALADTVANNLVSVAAIPSLAPCLDDLVLLVNDSTAGRRAFAGGALLAVADSLQRAGSALAYRAAEWAWTTDTERHAAIMQRDWFAARSRRLAVGRFVIPTVATVSGDSVVIAFRLETTAPMDSATARDTTAWTFRIGMPDADSAGAISLDVSVASTPASPPSATSGVLDGATTRIAASRVSGAAEWPAPTRLRPVAASMRPSADGFTVTARGAFVADLKRRHPSSATLFADSCGTVSGGLCSKPSIPIVYR